MNSVLVAENLNSKDVLKDINFNLKEGTINVLMGKNSCGKTLLFKNIFGITEFTGIVSVNGVIVTKDNIEEIRKKMGIYLGINNLENKNVFLNLIEPLVNLGYDDYKAKKKVYEISKKLGIENLLYKQVAVLSHSQKKVVSFTQSIIHEPKILMIDGLFDSLDIYYKDKIVTYLQQVKKSKKCIIIFTTNNIEDLLIADNLIIIKNGKILAHGKVNELVKDERLFIKNHLKLPFIIDLSYKLIAYDLIEEIVNDINEMVDEIWE